METSVNLSLSALVLSSALFMTGCSSGQTSTDATSAPTSSDTATSASAAPTATPTPTPKVSHGAGWVESVVTTAPLPAQWQGGSGWSINTPQGTNVSVQALQNSMLVITETEGVPATIATYDKNGNVIDKSPAITKLAPKGMKDPIVTSTWSQGKPYYMMLQGGPLVPDPNTTKATGWAVFFSSFSATTGKLAAQGMIPVRENAIDVRTHGGSVHLYDYQKETIVRTFIDPATGNTELNHDPEWEARTDGVDITSPGTGIPVVAAPNWTLENATLYIGSSLRSDTNLLAVHQYDANNNGFYRNIDVHTGVEPDWVANIADPKSYLVNLSGIHAGVYAFQNDESGLHTFINPTTGAIVKLTKEDTFKPENIGMDGVVYGTSAAVKGEAVPAYLDLNEGEAKTLGTKGTLSPVDVTGDGLAAFSTAKSIVFVNRVAK